MIPLTVFQENTSQGISAKWNWFVATYGHNFKIIKFCLFFNSFFCVLRYVLFSILELWVQDRFAQHESEAFHIGLLQANIHSSNAFSYIKAFIIMGIVSNSRRTMIIHRVLLRMSQTKATRENIRWLIDLQPRLRARLSYLIFMLQSSAPTEFL